MGKAIWVPDPNGDNPNVDGHYIFVDEDGNFIATGDESDYHDAIG